jgi:hypothetical protein
MTLKDLGSEVATGSLAESMNWVSLFRPKDLKPKLGFQKERLRLPRRPQVLSPWNEFIYKLFPWVVPEGKNLEEKLLGSFGFV